MFIYVILSDSTYKNDVVFEYKMQDLVCNRDKWIEGMWTFLIGLTLLLSSIFSVMYGQKIYSFAREKRLQEV